MDKKKHRELKVYAIPTDKQMKTIKKRALAMLLLILSIIITASSCRSHKQCSAYKNNYKNYKK